MSKFVSVAAAVLAATVGSLMTAPMAGAQTDGDQSAFCTAREGVGPDSNKTETAAALQAIAANATGDAAGPAASLRALFEKKGMKIFDGDKAFEYIGEIDAHYYDVCPATKLDVVATDFSFSGVPATVPAGPAAIRFDNQAPSEEHEIAMVKLTPAGEAKDPEALLPLPDRKIEKFIDFSTAAFAFAPAGETSYGIADLEPGTYIYACFVNEGGERKGTPHWEHGMWGTFEVQ